MLYDFVVRALPVIRVAAGKSSLGTVRVAVTEEGICAIAIGDNPGKFARDLRARFPGARITKGNRELRSAVTAARGLAEGSPDELGLPLDMRGTPFQCRIWRALREIPRGRTASYAQIARRIGKPTATRAVARACAANLIALAIPCHRAVRSDGRPSGYRWGAMRKAALLSRERK